MESEFQKALKELLNTHSMEGMSHTPDFVLAEYLMACLAAFDTATIRRTSLLARSMQHTPHGT